MHPVQADTLASQAEQLSSRRAYQQAHGAHTEAAKQYQLAAHATGDTGAAKALLLQRDKQLKLANEVLRKLERGKSKPAISTTSTAASSAPGQSNVPGAAPQSIGTGATHGSSYAHRAHYSGIGSPNHINHGGNAGQPPHRRNGQAMPSLSLQQNHYGNSTRIGAGAFMPRDRIDASTMADSRYSRKSNSPSQSQISHSIPQSGESVKTSSVEESYYLMNTDVRLLTSPYRGNI